MNGHETEPAYRPEIHRAALPIIEAMERDRDCWRQRALLGFGLSGGLAVGLILALGHFCRSSPQLMTRQAEEHTTLICPPVPPDVPEVTTRDVPPVRPESWPTSDDTPCLDREHVTWVYNLEPFVVIAYPAIVHPTNRMYSQIRSYHGFWCVENRRHHPYTCSAVCQDHAGPKPVIDP